MNYRVWGWLFFPLLLFCVWQVGAWRADPLLLPSPVSTLHALLELTASGELWRELSQTLYRVAVGVLIGGVVGIPFGLAIGSSRLFESLMGPAMPSIAATSSAIWAVLGLLWFGLSDGATIFVVAMTATPLFAINARDGIRSVDTDLVQLTQSMGFGRLAISRKVLLPSILPALFAGTRLALGFGARVGLVAEALGSPSGVGFRLKQAIDLMRTSEVFAWSLAVIVLMIALELVLLFPLERWTFRWRKPLSVESATTSAS
jgi:NitT/TauT family transport system permease protein